MLLQDRYDLVVVDLREAAITLADREELHGWVQTDDIIGMRSHSLDGLAGADGTFDLRWTLARGRVDAVDAVVAMDQAGSIGVLDEPRVGSMANVVTLRRADARLALRIDGWPGTVNAEDSIVLKLRRAREATARLQN